MLQYGNADIVARVISDRGNWYIEIADVADRADGWYDAAILRDLLLGPGEDVLPLSDQIEFIETHWPAIISRFNPRQQEATHAQLASLRKDRAKRRFPDLYPQYSGPSWTPRLVGGERSKNMTERTTFGELDHDGGSAHHSALPGLPQWYASVRNTEIRHLSLDDLCRAIRQRIHLTHVVPVAVKLLNDDPLAGYQYDGELLAAIARIPPEFWYQMPSVARSAIAAAQRARNSLDPDVQAEVDTFLGNAARSEAWGGNTKPR